MKTKNLIIFILYLAPLIITLIMLPIMPDQIPAQYGWTGEVTRYGSRYELLIMPIIAMFTGAFLTFASIRVAKGKSTQNPKLLFWASIAIAIPMVAMQIWHISMIYPGFEATPAGTLDSMRIMAIIISLSFVVLGNVLPKCRRNYFIGIRTPWTLKNEVCWSKTHRLAGILMLGTGLISTLLCLFVFDGAAAFYVVAFGLGVALIPALIYSYYVYRQEKEKARHD